eukprot:g4150.t1
MGCERPADQGFESRLSRETIGIKAFGSDPDGTADPAPYGDLLRKVVRDVQLRHRAWGSMNSDVSSEKEDKFDGDELVFAVTLIEDALHGRKHGIELESYAQLRLYRIFHTPYWRNITFILSWALLLLTAVEPPSTSSSRTAPTHGMWPVVITVFVEAICVIVLWVDVIVHRMWLGKKHFMRHGWALTKALVLCLISIDLVLMALPFVQTVRFSRPFRPWLLVSRMRNVRNSFSAAVRTVPAFLPTLSLLCFLVAQSGLLAWLIFDPHDPTWKDIPNNSTPSGFCSTYATECDAYFSTLSDSVWQTVLLLSGITFPDVALPYWEASRWSIVFFIFNLLVGYWFLMRLLVAASYNRYHEECMKNIDTRRQRESIALNGAFTIARGMERKGVSLARWREMMKHMKRQGLHTDAAFLEIADGDRHLKNIAEFRRAVTFLELRVSENSKLYHGCSSTISHLSEEPWFRLFFDVLAICSVARMIVVRLTPHIRGDVRECRWDGHHGVHYSAEGCVLGVMAWVILSLFILEIVAKGWRIFDDWLSIIDSTISVCAMIGAISSSPVHADFFLLIGNFRALRLLRLLRLTRSSQSFLNALASVAPVLIRFLVIFSALGYFFAVIGMEVFYGNLGKEDVAVVKSAYGQQNLWSLNFDNFAASLATVFAMLMVRKFPAIMEGCIAGASNSVFSVVFFVGFYIIAVLFLSNIFVAFILESYTVVHDSDPDQGSSKVKSLISRIAQITNLTEADVRKKWSVQKIPRFADTHKKLHHIRGASNGTVIESTFDAPLYLPLTDFLEEAATQSDIQRLRTVMTRLGIELKDVRVVGKVT